MELSNALVLKLVKEGKLGTVLKYIFDVTKLKVRKWYTINSRERTRVELTSWLKYQVDETELIRVSVNLKGKTEKETILNILKYVHKLLTYVGDDEVWDMPENWSRAIDTFRSERGDCEDGAILIYVLAHLCDIPDYRIQVVAGDVVGGGHAYCVWTDDNGIEYPIDWCYWYTKSVALKVPYYMRYEYNQGQKEWFRTSISGSYINK